MISEATKVLRPAAGLALAVLLSGLPAAADWLVTRQGGRLETRGPWEVKGKLVVFKAADGTLASLRLADLDLDASRKATDEAARLQAEAEPARGKPPERKASRVVLTDKDFRKAEPAPASAPAATGDTEAEPALAATEPEAELGAAGVNVSAWERGQDEAGGHVVITGTLENRTAATAADVRLAVELYDESGEMVASAQASLAPAIPAGGQTRFSAAFPGVFAFADAKFEVSSVALATRTAAAPSPGAQ